MSGTDDNVQHLLTAELGRLKELLHLDSALSVTWEPDDGSETSGEVRDGTIRIYERDKARALAVLRHECADILISKSIVEPLTLYINMQKRLISGMIYERKETVIEKICGIIEARAPKRELSR